MSVISTKCVIAIILGIFTTLAIAPTLAVEPRKAPSRHSKTPIYLPIESNGFEDLLWRLRDNLLGNGVSDVTIKTTDNWHAYQQGLRSGSYGIYFAPSHFAAWAVSQHGFIPLVRLLEPLSYVIAAPRNAATIFEINDLANAHVCATRPLNLDYLLVNSAFDNRLLSANVKIVSNVEQEMSESESECDGFSVGNHVFERLEKTQPDRFIRLQQSSKYNNFVLLAHPDVSVSDQQAVLSYFLSKPGHDLLEPMLRLFANNTKLVKSRRTDYPAHYMDELRPYWRVPLKAD